MAKLFKVALSKEARNDVLLGNHGTNYHYYYFYYYYYHYHVHHRHRHHLRFIYCGIHDTFGVIISCSDRQSQLVGLSAK